MSDFEERFRLSKEYQIATQQVKAYHSSLNLASQTILKCDITTKELNNLKENEKVFRSVGRMFILSDKEEVTSMIATQKEKIEKESIKYQEMKKVYEKKRDGTIEAIKEYEENHK